MGIYENICGYCKRVYLFSTLDFGTPEEQPIPELIWCKQCHFCYCLEHEDILSKHGYFPSKCGLMKRYEKCPRCVFNENTTKQHTSY